MGLFDKFKKEKPTLFDTFEHWLNTIFEKDISSDVVALNFNIYEDAGNRWSVEVVGTSSFDEESDDWACDEVTVFNTRDNPFSWQEKLDWEEVLDKVKVLVWKYLETGQYLEKLKEVRGIACGFVDGDLELLYVNKR